jgi:hypothetical protein
MADKLMAVLSCLPSNISALEQTGAGNRTRVDGGGGVDTLKLDGAGLTWHRCQFCRR